MGNQLGFDNPSFDIPDCTGRVDAGCPNSPGLDLVPIERRQWGAEFAGFAVVENREGFDRIFADFPEAEVVAGGGEKVGGIAGVRVEHEFGGRVRMVEGQAGEGPDG